MSKFELVFVINMIFSPNFRLSSISFNVKSKVPDGMMVFFSGIGKNSENEIMVGVGTLAGSTIMLLTIAWWICVFGGRVEI